MGHTTKDNSMNSCRPSNSLKQGYLNIKRERSTSLFVKPWQQAYFILCRDPFMMAEYKDASLKTQKQVHVIGTIRHVGIIRTSKSQQFAFEVVMKEMTPLLLSCENHSLRDEWISAFVEVMNTISCVDMDLCCCNPPPRADYNDSFHHPSLHRRSSFYEVYNVVIVESALSQYNELFGDYNFTVTPIRMSLLSCDDNTDILSWTLGNVMYYTVDSSLNHVILVMSRTCHFGCGKLILQTKQCDKVFKLIEMYKSKSSTNYRSAGSSGGAGAGCRSGNSSSSLSNGSNSLSDKSPLSLSYDDDQPVFDVTTSETKLAGKGLKTLGNDRAMRSFSSPDIYENGYEKSVATNTHKKLKSTNNSLTHSSNTNTCNSATLPKKINCGKSENDIQTAFAEITSEEGYILPNEQDVDFNKTKTLLNRNEQHTFPDYHTPSGSDNETETSSSSYLQIVDSDENSDDPVVKKMLNDLTSSLIDPVNSNSFCNSLNESWNARKRTDSPKLAAKYNKEYRRSSEPVKNMPSPLDRDASKVKSGNKTRSIDCVDTDHLSKSHNSPLLSNKLHQAVPSYHKNNAFPKIFSVSHGTTTNNPFGKLESYFLKHQGRQNKVRSPELDRNTKPKPNNKCSMDCNVNNKNLSSAHNNIPNTDAVDYGSPPPVPNRQSPNPLYNRRRHQLHREHFVEEHEDALRNPVANSVPVVDIDSGSDSTEEENQTSELRDSESSVDSLHNHTALGTKNRSNKIDGLLLPPPLPPKSKPLSCTKSAPTPGREREHCDDKGVLMRCSSLDSKSKSDSDQEDQEIDSLNFTISTSDSHNLGEENDDIPPVVPRRLPTIVSMDNKKRLSTSEGHLLKASIEKIPKFSNIPKISNINNNVHNDSSPHYKSSDVQLPLKEDVTKSSISDNNTNNNNDGGDSCEKLASASDKNDGLIESFHTNQITKSNNIVVGITSRKMTKIFGVRSASFPKSPKEFLSL